MYFISLINRLNFHFIPQQWGSFIDNRSRLSAVVPLQFQELNYINNSTLLEKKTVHATVHSLSAPLLHK